MLVWWQEVVGYRAVLHWLCTVKHAEHPCWPSKRLLQPQFPICHQNALKAQFNVLSSVCIVLVKVPLYSDRSRVLCWTVHRVFQTDRFVCMQNTRSRHLETSLASEMNMKVMKLTQLHLDEQTGLYKTERKKKKSQLCRWPWTWSIGLPNSANSIQDNGC